NDKDLDVALMPADSLDLARKIMLAQVRYIAAPMSLNSNSWGQASLVDNSAGVRLPWLTIAASQLFFRMTRKFLFILPAALVPNPWLS
ncbi:MAG TPA: hypothetical protein VJ910_06740, partial [Desulfuromonadales bacterium]|nr:hypothetical protein [Desulfuromonadales bacterium]